MPKRIIEVERWQVGAADRVYRTGDKFGAAKLLLLALQARADERRRVEVRADELQRQLGRDWQALQRSLKRLADLERVADWRRDRRSVSVRLAAIGRRETLLVAPRVLRCAALSGEAKLGHACLLTRTGGMPGPLTVTWAEVGRWLGAHEPKAKPGERVRDELQWAELIDVAPGQGHESEVTLLAPDDAWLARIETKERPHAA